MQDLCIGIPHKFFFSLLLFVGWFRWQMTSIPPSQVPELLRENATRAPTAMALEDLTSGARFTTVQLEQWVQRCARAMQDAVLRNSQPPRACTAPQPLIVLLLPLGTDVAIAELACLGLGYVFLPWAPNDESQRFRDVMASMHPDVVIDEEWMSKTRVQSETSIAPVLDLRLRSLQLQPTDLAYVVFTSGTTGVAKGVLVERRQIDLYVEGFASLLRNTRMDQPVPYYRILTSSSPTFDPSIADVMTAVLLGATLVTCSQQQRDSSFTDVLARSRATSVVTTPALWGAVDKASFFASRSPTSNVPLQVFLGGEATPPHLVELWCSTVEMYNVYGVTEAVVYQAVHRFLAPQNANPTWTGGIGRSILAQTVLSAVEIVCDDGPAGGESQARELVISGPQVARGYVLVKKEHDGVEFTKFEGVLHTGDLVVEAAGCSTTGTAAVCPCGIAPCVLWSLCGRRDMQVKHRGRRVSLEEVEALLERLSIIKKCLCVTTSATCAGGTGSTKEIAALCELQGLLPTTPRELVQRSLRVSARSLLPDYMQPDAFLFLCPSVGYETQHPCCVAASAWRHTTNNKIDRVWAKEMVAQTFAKQQDQSRAPSAPAAFLESSALLRAVAEEWGSRPR